MPTLPLAHGRADTESIVPSHLSMLLQSWHRKTGRLPTCPEVQASILNPTPWPLNTEPMQAEAWCEVTVMESFPEEPQVRSWSMSRLSASTVAEQS